jgi:hypothetical protein
VQDLFGHSDPRTTARYARVVDMARTNPVRNVPVKLQRTETWAGSGVDAVFMPGQALDLINPAVKVVTLKPAKGPEFPVVALAGFHGNAALGVPTGGDIDKTKESVEAEATIDTETWKTASCGNRSTISLSSATQTPSSPCYSRSLHAS